MPHALPLFVAFDPSIFIYVLVLVARPRVMAFGLSRLCAIALCCLFTDHGFLTIRHPAAMPIPLPFDQSSAEAVDLCSGALLDLFLTPYQLNLETGHVNIQYPERRTVFFDSLISRACDRVDSFPWLFLVLAFISEARRCISTFILHVLPTSIMMTGGLRVHKVS